MLTPFKNLKLLTLALIVGSIGVAHAETSSYKSSAMSDSSSAMKSTKDSYKTQQDQQINQRIRDKMKDFKDVTLSTSDGVVTLEGNVESASDQQKIQSEVQKMDGVKSVKNNLKVKKY